MADNIVSVGNSTSRAGKVKFHKDGSNHSTTYTHSGEFAEMSALYNSYYIHGYSVDLEQEDAEEWNLTATIAVDLSSNTPDPGGGGTNEIPEITWDLNDKVDNKSILDVDNVYVNWIPNFIAKLITDAISGKKEEILINGMNFYLKDKAISNTTYQAALIVYHHMAAGIKTVPVYHPILTKNATSSQSWIIDWSERNKGKIYSTATLISEENVPARLHNALPSDVFAPSLRDDLFIPKAYGWLKGGIRSQVSNHGRNIINQSWEYGLWPTAFFGLPI